MGGFARGGFFWKKKRWKLRTGEGEVEKEVPGGEKEKKMEGMVRRGERRKGWGSTFPGWNIILLIEKELGWVCRCGYG